MNLAVRIFLVLVCFTLLTNCSRDSKPYRNYQHMMGKKNPYVSFVKGDSVMLYQRDKTSIKLINKMSTQEKILMDLRVLNRNQTTLEIWLGASLLLNLVCIFFLIRVFLALRRKE